MNIGKKITYQSQINIPELLPPFNGAMIQPFIDPQILKRPFMGIDMQPFAEHE